MWSLQFIAKLEILADLAMSFFTLFTKYCCFCSFLYSEQLRMPKNRAGVHKLFAEKDLSKTLKHNPIKYQTHYLNLYNTIWSKVPLTEDIKSKLNLLIGLFAFAKPTIQ